MNPEPIGGSGRGVVSSWLCYGVTIAIVAVAVGCIFGVSYVVYRSSAIPQGFLDTMQLLEADTDGTALVVRANAMTNDDVSRAIEVIRSVEFRSKPRSSLDVLSEVRRADSVSMTVHDSMLLAVRREDAAGSAIMESLERFLTMTPLPDYSEPVASEWYFGTRYSPIPTLAWALVRLKGIDGFNELSHRFSTIETQSEWKQEILRFTGVLSWADYHAAEVDTTVPPMSSAFDDRWLVRFTAAAQERGYTLFASDSRQTGSELERILRDFETDYFGKSKTPTIKELWLAASASITLRELDLSDKGRRVFPFGMGLTHLLWSPRGGKGGEEKEKVTGREGVTERGRKALSCRNLLFGMCAYVQRIYFRVVFLGFGVQCVGASRGSGRVFGFRARGTATNVRRATWTVYDDAHHQVRTAQGYATGAQWDTFTLINPVSITNSDEAGNVLAQIQAVRGSTSGKPN